MKTHIFFAVFFGWSLSFAQSSTDGRVEQKMRAFMTLSREAKIESLSKMLASSVQQEKWIRMVLSSARHEQADFQDERAQKMKNRTKVAIGSLAAITLVGVFKTLRLNQLEMIQKFSEQGFQGWLNRSNLLNGDSKVFEQKFSNHSVRLAIDDGIQLREGKDMVYTWRLQLPKNETLEFTSKYWVKDGVVQAQAGKSKLSFYKEGVKKVLSDYELKPLLRDAEFNVEYFERRFPLFQAFAQENAFQMGKKIPKKGLFSRVAPEMMMYFKNCPSFIKTVWMGVMAYFALEWSKDEFVETSIEKTITMLINLDQCAGDRGLDALCVSRQMQNSADDLTLYTLAYQLTALNLQ